MNKQNSILVYLDWGVMNKIEKNVDSIHGSIERAIESGQIIVPYSNAHLQDLVRGYRKNPNFIDGHLSCISRLTNDLCIAQYWKQPKELFHKRDPRDFFKEIVEKKVFEERTMHEYYFGLMREMINYIELFDTYESKMDVIKGVQKMLDFVALSKSTPLPSNFKSVFVFHPIFAKIFENASVENTFWGLVEDMFQLHNTMAIDPAAYRALREIVNVAIGNLPDKNGLYKGIWQMSMPKELMDEVKDKLNFSHPVSSNPTYDLILNTYFKEDFIGQSSDYKFQNMIDDGLHCFYGAHAPYFLSNDRKCVSKAKATYKKLGIKTAALSPADFVEMISKG